MDDVSLPAGSTWKDSVAPPAPTISPLADFYFSKGALVGRFREGAEPVDQVAITIDRQDCGSAQVSEIEGGARQFLWLLPTRFYDEQEHTASVRTGRDVEIGKLQAVFSNKYRPIIEAGVRLSHDGKLIGYAHNANWARKRVDLELWIGPQAIAAVRCDQPNPSFAPADIPEQRGFVVDLPAIDSSLFDQPMRVVVADFGDVINEDPYLLSKSFRLESASSGESIAAIVSCPDCFQDLAFDVFVDGEPVGYSHRRISGARVLSIAHDDGRTEAVTVSVRLPSGADVAGSPVVASRSAFCGLRNPRFDRWTGGAPAHWSVAEGVIVRPISSGADAAIAVEVPVERTPASPIMRQPFDLAGAGTHLRLAVRARSPGGAVIRAGVRGTDGSCVESAVHVGAAWADHTLRLSLPPPGARADAVLEIALPECPFRRIDFAQIDVVRGDSLGASLPTDALPEAAGPDLGPWNAVANGAFERWSKGFEFPVTAGRRELADGWFSLAKKDAPAARVRLAPIPEPKTGSDPPKTLYGLEISGVIGGSSFAVETDLDRNLLARSPAGDLVFVSALPSSGPGQGINHPSSIRRVSVVGRNPAGEAEVLATIASNIGVGRAPRRHRLNISKAVGDLILAAARAPSRDELRLRFEFDPGPSDVIIAAVTFGRVAEGTDVAAAAQRSPSSDYLAFEDPTIVGQLGRLKGLESWSSPLAVSSSKAAAALPSRPWAWGHSHATVDIVVPVYNALEEVESCLDSLERRTGRPHRLIIVNDKSNLATSEFLRGHAAARPWVTLIENPKNLGYTRSSNIGLRASDAEWVVLLNSDTVVSDNWLEAMLECASADHQTAMVGPVSNAATWQSVPELRDARGGWMVNSLPAEMSVDEIAAIVRESSSRDFPDVPLLNGFCTLMRRDVIAAVGFLDEQAFPVGYGEENDLCIRVKKAGYGIRVADHVYVYHKKSASFGSVRRMTLAKQGLKACVAKHPDVSLESLTQLMADCGPLIELRASLKRALRLRPTQNR
jgi:GT2 family glycosyltransferase